MMKKTLLAVAIPALLAGGVVNAATIYNNDGSKVELYGQLRMNVEYDSGRDGSGEDGTKVRDSGSRFGFKAAHDLGNGLRGFAGLEYGNNTQQGEDSFKFKNRLGYVGIGAEGLGDISVGRVKSPFDDVAMSDYSYVYGGVMDFGAGYTRSDSTDNFIGRTSNTIKYVSESYNGLSFGGTYTLQSNEGWGSKDSATDRTKKVKNAFTLSTFYKSDFGLILNAGYGRAKANGGADAVDSQNNPLTSVTKGNEDIWGVGAEYKIGDLSVAVDVGQFNMKKDVRTEATGSVASTNQKANLYGVGAKYQWSEKGRVYVGGFMKDGKKDISKAKTELLVVGTGYHFTENVRPYIEYAHQRDKNVGTNVGTKKTNKVAVGMRVYF